MYFLEIKRFRTKAKLRHIKYPFGFLFHAHIYIYCTQVITRCRKYEKELFFRNLLEASLRQSPDSDNEEGALAATILKSRSFEELLAYQVRGYNLKGAQETLATAQSLGVHLSADYHELYMDLEKEVATDFGRKPIKATLNWLKQAFTPLEKEGGK